MKNEFYEVSKKDFCGVSASYVGAGYCGGLSAGNHELQIYVSQEFVNSDCYTGWDTSSWLLEVQEVSP